MKRGYRADVKMQKSLCHDLELDGTVYQGELLQYNENKECIYILINSNDLTKISLDAIYVCEIYADTECLQCTGRVKERYCHELGNVLKMEIENGFYKINIK